MVDTWNYDQVAIATSFAHSMGHGDISVEYHRAAGPFTTVPLPGDRSSLVWMERPARAEAIMTLSDKDLAAEIQIATHGELGLISAIGPRKAFPMKGLTARQFARNRTILVGEAAHVVPPIGAQGLNMSLRDAGHAVDVLLGHKDAGADDVMEQYHAARAADVLQRQAAITMLNRSLLAEFLPLDIMRVGALSAIASFPPLRGLVMREGLAPQGHLPVAMR